MSDDPVLQSLAARVIVAIDRIETGRADDALSVLQLLNRILPEPTKHNLRAAEFIPKRDRVG